MDFSDYIFIMILYWLNKCDMHRYRYFFFQIYLFRFREKEKIVYKTNTIVSVGMILNLTYIPTCVLAIIHV